MQVMLSDNARAVLEKRYLLKDETGAVIETPEEMFKRVAHEIALPDANYDGDVTETEREFYELLASKRFMPNSPTFTGAGTALGQLAACYVLSIADDMGREEDSIFSTLRKASLIYQGGGGVGFSFSNIRPRGDVVKSSGGIASGPLSFLRVYDAAVGTVEQGGVRRGAAMGVLDVTHPDILDFIRCKGKEGDLSNFNLSVGITDDFMQAVKDDDEFNLVNPRTGEIWRTVQAREIFDEIVDHAWTNGEPGVLFLDAINRGNPMPMLYEIKATNPCGEQPLGPGESCCLGSINLSQYISEENAGLDWQGLERDIYTAVHFLDNVIDANKFVPSLPELALTARLSRRVGLGIMGLGDVFFELGVRYGSPKSIIFAEMLMEFVRFHAMSASVQLARNRGAFHVIEHSIYASDGVCFKPHFANRHESSRVSEGDWQSLSENIKKYGIRNAATTTIAPTGTIATVAGCEAYGCEPVFALAYTRHMRDGDARTSLTYTSPLFQNALIASGISPTDMPRILDDVAKTGSCQGVDGVPLSVQRVFVVANDILPLEHVAMQAALQRWVDGAISKTVNLRETATRQDVRTSIIQAWEMGCKGLTVYRAGSRQSVVLETKTRPVDAPARSRDAVLSGSTQRIQTPVGTAFVTVNHDADRRPFEVFVTIGKAGSDIFAMSEAIGRLASLALQIPSSLAPQSRLEKIINQLKDIGGRNSHGFGPSRVSSLPDAVAIALKRYLAIGMVRSFLEEDKSLDRLESAITDLESAITDGDMCPQCGNVTVIRTEGCLRCVSPDCGYSEC